MRLQDAIALGGRHRGQMGQADPALARGLGAVAKQSLPAMRPGHIHQPTAELRQRGGQGAILSVSSGPCGRPVAQRGEEGHDVDERSRIGDGLVPFSVRSELAQIGDHALPPQFDQPGRLRMIVLERHAGNSEAARNHGGEIVKGTDHPGAGLDCLQVRLNSAAIHPGDHAAAFFGAQRRVEPVVGEPEGGTQLAHAQPGVPLGWSHRIPPVGPELRVERGLDLGQRRVAITFVLGD